MGEKKSHVYYHEHWNRERPSNYLLCLHSLRVKSYLMTSLLPQPSTAVKAPTQTSSYTNRCTQGLCYLVLFPNMFITPSQKQRPTVFHRQVQWGDVHWNQPLCHVTRRKFIPSKSFHCCFEVVCETEAKRKWVRRIGHETTSVAQVHKTK